MPLGGLLIALAASEASGALTGPDILRRALDLSAEVQDYTAQVQMTSNLPDVQSQFAPFTVYFKRPDKVSVKSRGLVIVPRDALTFGNLAQRIEQGTQILLVGTKTVGGVPYYSLKLIPKESRDPSRVLVTIEGRHWTISQMQVVEGAKTRAAFTWEYALVDGRFRMPAKIRCHIPGLPMQGANQPGEVTVSFSGYKVNSGLGDELFKSTTPPPPRRGPDGH
jgi:outer membrane lipoprotein-sorting protein